MKKLLLLLSFPVFFCSCPMEDINSGDRINIYIHNKTSQIIGVVFNFELRSSNWSYKKDSVLPDSTSQLCEKGFDDIIGDKAVSALRERFCNKNLLIKNVDGDTLVLWSDSSLIFLDQYWTVNTQDKGEFTGCTLQLTDEVLKLK